LAQNNEIVLGAESIITQCLGVGPNEPLALFVDETTCHLVDSFALAAQKHQIDLTTLFFSRDQQRITSQLNGHTKVLLDLASAVLLALTADDSCSTFRTKMVSMWRGRMRLGTMPGASERVLRTAYAMRNDYDHMKQVIRRYTTPLLLGRHCEVVTRDGNGGRHELSLELGGVARVPVQSLGMLKESGWGNVPSGEVFVAPLEHSANGTIVIDGAVGTFVVPEGERVLLTFANGRLVDHRFQTTGNPVDHLSALAALSRERHDANWNVFAELGIGVNERIHEVTGVPLLDEKIRRTIHVAIGHNKGWQGDNRSDLHLDMTTWLPDVAIDGRPILQQGEQVVRPEDFDSLDHYRPPEKFEWPGKDERVRSQMGQARTPELDKVSEFLRHGGRTIRIIPPQTGQVTEFALTDQELIDNTQILARAIKRPRSKDCDASGVLAELAPEKRRRLLSLLWSLGVIEPVR
jgi:leucyl aminopeptidase (aminopeptidase T)